MAESTLAAGKPRSLPLDFEALLALSPNPYVLLDRDLRIVWMNDAYLRVTMRNREDIIDRRMFEAFPADPDSESFQLLDRSLRRVLDTGKPDEIALIRYDIHNPDGTLSERYWSATHNPLLDEDGNVACILQHTVDVTELHELRRERDEAGLMRRAQAVQDRNRDLTQEAQQLRALFEQAPSFIALLGGPDHRFMLVNRAYRRLIGGREVTGQTIAEALPEVVDQGFVDLLDEVYRTGTPYFGHHERVALLTDAQGTQDRFLDFIYQPIRSEDGTVSGVFVEGYDVTDEVHAEERQKLLINELNHRVKNTLAIVQGLALQSFRRIEGSEDAQRTFNSRLHALSSAHNLLTQQNWTAARLIETLRSSVEATAGQNAERIGLSGPDVMLPPQLAVSLAMIVHELGTNAIKYGALSTDAGRVELGWRLERAESRNVLTMTWVESGGPEVSAPTRHGFGTRLIERGLATDGGRVVLDYAAQGLRCTIEAPLPDIA